MCENFTGGGGGRGRNRGGGGSFDRIEVCLKLGGIKFKKKGILNIDLSTFVATFVY